MEGFAKELSDLKCAGVGCVASRPQLRLGSKSVRSCREELDLAANHIVDCPDDQDPMFFRQAAERLAPCGKSFDYRQDVTPADLINERLALLCRHLLESAEGLRGDCLVDGTDDMPETLAAAT